MCTPLVIPQTLDDSYHDEAGILISLKISKCNLTAWLADVLPPISIGH